MLKRKIRLLLALAALAVSCVLLAWSLWPPFHETRNAPIAVTGLQLPTSLQAALPESRSLRLEWPSAIRLGDAGVIRLTLEVDGQGNPTPAVGSTASALRSGAAQIPNLYATHNVVAEARLDLPGLQVMPPEAVNEPLRPGQPVTFYWRVSPWREGIYRGQVWLHLRFIPLDGGAESRQAVSVQPIAIKAVTFLGLTAGAAQVAGVAASFFGAFLGFPFLEVALRWLWQRLGR